MTRSYFTRVARTLACAASLGAAAACGGTRAGVADVPAPATSGTVTASPGSVVASPAAIAKARADSARLPWTRADAEFMTHMIGHHAQAIEMGRLAPGRAEDPAVLRLAERIISAQRDEIVTMQQWLADRRQPVPEPPAKTMDHGAHAAHAAAGAQPGGHGGHGAHGGAHGGTSAAAASSAMPGMLTAAQIRQLEQARGREFDRLFLTYMIQHHQGAVAMVEKLFGTYGAGQDEAVFKFASDVQVDQRTEIARMQRMLLLREFEKAAP